ncbi:MAG: hypothetical protein JWL66_1047 [Sphingomonadales bacterium]|nr:hypothetical protein [Sphingomonadales bacterium]
MTNALEYLVHHILRAAQTNALVGLHQRSINQRGIDRHRVQYRVTIRIGQAKFLGIGPSNPQSLTRRDPGPRIQMRQPLA